MFAASDINVQDWHKSRSPQHKSGSTANSQNANKIESNNEDWIQYSKNLSKIATLGKM